MTELLDPNMEQLLQIGELIGETKAFTRVAGRCTAAKAQALATIHEKKQYRALDMDWETFCKEKLGINRRLADQHIRDLKEFGRQYFDLAQLTPITAPRYRMIAPAINEKGLLHNGETIAFTEHEAPRLAAAIEELTRTKMAESCRKPGLPLPAIPMTEPYVAADRALDEAVRLCAALVNHRKSSGLGQFCIRLDMAIKELSEVRAALR
jgi:hypothetical protein